MADAGKKKTRKEKRAEAWQAFRQTLPDAIQLARPQAALWTLGLGLLLVGRIAGLVLPAAPKFLIDSAIPNGDTRQLYLIIGAVLVATLIQGLCAFALTQTISKAGQRLIAQLRARIHHHVSRLPIRYYDNHKTGEVVSRVMNDVEGVRNLVGTGMVEFIGGVLTAAMAFAILLWLNWQLTLGIFVFLIVFAAVMIGSFSVLGPIFKERQELTADISGRLTEGVAGIRVVKAYNMEPKERTVFGDGIQSLLRNVLRTINAISLVALSSAVLIGILGSLIMVVGGRQLMAGTLTIGEFISYILYLGFLVAPVSSIVMIGTQLSEAFVGLQRMKEVLREEPEDADEESRAPMPAVDGRVEFRDVSFEYDTEKPVLHNVSFVAEPGTVTALVGPSGSGKSTLIGLVAAFFSPKSGAILVDQRDLCTVRVHDYRASLGVVLQENFLFAGTIKENLLYIRPDATETALREAIRLAHCDEFVDRFPDGMDTVIGERGVKLSGGQRQRLAIARALLANPRILILDEATSALDSESEARIQEGLATLMRGRTSFVIAHRLSTIRKATTILVLEDGRIVERGTHAELLARKGRYSEMYSLQHGVEENVFNCPGEKSPEESGEAPQKESKSGSRGSGGLSRLLIGED